MKREDYIAIIKAVETIMKIEEACISLTGVGLEQGDGNDVYLLWEVLRRNSSKKYHVSSDLDQDSENYEAFIDIITDTMLSAEEKWEKLVN